MSEKQYDFTILTDHRWINPKRINDYTSNVLLEDRLLLEALERKHFKVNRKSWDDKSFDWSSTKFVILEQLGTILRDFLSLING